MSAASRYENVACPICDEKMTADAQVVVCPECGAPYHLECYRNSGKCVFDDLHAAGESWQPPQPEAAPEDTAEQYDGRASTRCTRCGTVNPPTGIFCQVCGNELAGNDTQQEQQPYGGQVPPMGIPLNPYTTPFGGVNPDEDIDEIPAKELAAFVGRNSHYYLPRFNQLSKTNNRGKIINWAGFFFTGWYYIYRRMYGVGILITLVNLVLSIPSVMLAMSQYEMALTMQPVTQETSLIASLNMLCSMLMLFLRFFSGFFANSFYFKFAKRRISSIRSATSGQGDEAYMQLLSKKGSVAIKLTTGLLIAYFAFNLISMIMLMFSP